MRSLYQRDRKEKMCIMASSTRSEIELFLLEFGVRYRKLGDDLYFCMLPNGLTFDLLCSDHGNIQMWRFIDTAPLEKAGTRYTCSKANATLGVEVTDEGDVKLFTEFQCTSQIEDFSQDVNKILVGYFDMITQYERRKSTVG